MSTTRIISLSATALFFLMAGTVSLIPIDVHASEVLGTLSSSGQQSPSGQQQQPASSNDAISGTVVSPSSPSGGGSGSAPSNNGAPVSSVSASPSSGSNTGTAVSTPSHTGSSASARSGGHGIVLGASKAVATPVASSSGSGTSSLAVNDTPAGVTTGDSNQVAAAAAPDAFMNPWLWLLIAMAVALVGYAYYVYSRRSRRY